MSLLNSLKPEYRSAILATRRYVEPPAKTPAHIKARMVACMTAYCEKRSLTPAEERSYQNAATAAHAMRPRPVISDQTAVKKQIADWNKRYAAPTIDRRHGELALRYRALSYDQIKRAVANGYSEDVCNALNLAELSKQCRYQSGSAEDAEQLFRDKDGIHPEAARTTAEHEESAKYHANCAAKAKTLHEAESHYHAADRHKQAAEHPNDILASDRARVTSGLLKG
jgi:hypothetical protein